MREWCLDGCGESNIRSDPSEEAHAFYTCELPVSSLDIPTGYDFQLFLLVMGLFH